MTFRLVSAFLLSLLIVACTDSNDSYKPAPAEPSLESIRVEPALAEIDVGGTAAFSAVGIYSDGTEQVLAGQVSWSSTDAAVAAVDRLGVATGLQAGTVAISASVTPAEGEFSASASLTVVQPPPVVSAVEVYPPAANIPLGVTQDFRAIAIYSDGTTENVTFQANWYLQNDTAILERYEPGAVPKTIDDFGTALAVSEGADTLVAELSDIAGAAEVVVTPALLESIHIGPRDESRPVGAEVQYRATGTYSDGRSKDITRTVTWSSTAPDIAGISNEPPLRGRASALAEGETTISATLEGLTDATRLRVSGDPITDLDVFPVSAAIQVGGQLQYQAIAYRASGASTDVTREAAWASSDAAVASAAAGGLVRGVGVGTSTISAVFAGASGAGQLQVSAATPVSLRVEPAETELFSLQTRQFRATAIYSDGRQRDVSAEVLWTSDTPAVLGISNSDDFGRGLALGLAPGQSRVGASLASAGLQGFALATVLAVDGGAVKLEVSPPLANILVGEKQPYTATAVLTGGRAFDVSSFVSWLSSDPAVASIDADGVARGESSGSVSIVARLAGANASLDASAALSVRQPAGISQVVVSPPLSEVLVGDTQRFSAAALLDDGRSVDISDDVAWSIADDGIAQIDATGLAVGTAAGSTRVFATLDYQGAYYQGDAGLSVLAAATIEEIVVTPPAATIQAGQQQQYQATARLSDGRDVPVTDDVSWRTSDASVAQVDSAGLALGLAAGSTEISAVLVFEGVSYSGSADLAVTALTVESIQVRPGYQTARVGDAMQYRAYAILSDQSYRDITEHSSWFTADPSVAVVESGTRAGLATALAAGQTAVYIEFSYQGVDYNCAGDAACEAQFEVEPSPVTTLQVLPSVAEILVAESQQYQALAVLDNGDKVDVTDEVTWSSSDGGVASVDPSGLAVGLVGGVADIQASLFEDDNVLNDTARLSVLSAPVTVEEIVVTPANETILAGTTLQYTATAILSDGGKVDITDEASWSSTDPGIATMDEVGLAYGLAEGTVTVEAAINYQGTRYSGDTSLSVDAPLTIREIQVTPRSAELLVNETAQFSATAVLSDLSTRDVTEYATWFTADPQVATIGQGAEAGLATAVSEGVVAVWASVTWEGEELPCQGVIRCQASLRVEDPVGIDRLQVTPVDASLIVESTQQYKAQAVFTDGEVVDVTDVVSWTTGDPAIASLQGAAGLVIGLSPGQTTVSASGDYQGNSYSDTVGLTVEPQAIVIEELLVEPPFAERYPGDFGIYRAFARLSNGEVQDVSGDVVWTSADTTVAVIDPTTGEAQAVAPGATLIEARLDYNGEQSLGQAELVVKADLPYLLEVSPAVASEAAGGSLQYAARLFYESGREETVTGSVTWSSSDESVAAISNVVGSRGRASALAQGVATIAALHDSGVTGSAQLTVTQAALLGVTVYPDQLDLFPGDTGQLSAIADYSDDSQLDVTAEADWSSAATAVAVVGNGPDDAGTVQAVAPGGTTVSALFGGFSDQALVDVQSPAFVAGWIEPGSNTMQVGELQDYRAFGEFSDGINREITDEVVWSSSDSAVAQVSNRNDVGAGLVKGRVQALADGSAAISATLAGVNVDSSPLTVIGRTLQQLTVAPASVELHIGDTRAFSATALYSDNTSENVTADSVWSSSNDGVVLVSNDSGREGIASAVAEGSVSIVALYNGIEAAASVTVLGSDGSCGPGKPESVLIAADQTVPEGQTVRFTASGIWSDGCTEDITEDQQVVWQSLDKKICEFDGPKASIATGLSEGVGTVEVKLSGVKDTATCTVTPRED